MESSGVEVADSPKARRSPTRRSTRKLPIPEDFAISDRVRDWAAGKGFDRLEAHLESFIGKARAKAYTYVDWDEAFMGAIRDDWAKVRSSGGDAGPAIDDSKPGWALKAGFANRFEAENAGCKERNANQFRAGRRVEVSA